MSLQPSNRLDVTAVGIQHGICQGFSPQVILRGIHLQRGVTCTLTWLKDRRQK